MASIRGPRTKTVQGKKGERNCDGYRSYLTTTRNGVSIQPRCVNQGLESGKQLKKDERFRHELQSGGDSRGGGYTPILAAKE